MKILLAIDDSVGSRAAIEEVGRRSWASDSTLIVLTVYEMQLRPMAEPWLLPRDENRVLKTKREQAKALVEAAASKLRSKARRNLKIKTNIARGRPTKEIIKLAERSGIDLIVLGSHGHTGWKRLLLGSTAHAVALHANCSVEIVRRHKKHRR